MPPPKPTKPETDKLTIPQNGPPSRWHTLVLWRNLAELARNYFYKGSLVYIEGKLKTRHDDKEGNRRYVTEMVAEQLIMLDNKTDDN